MRGIAAGLLTIALAGCAGHRAPVSELEANGAAVFLYLDALPAGAERLQAELGAVRLLGSEDGADAPLTLALPRLEAEGGKHQRLLAFGMVPPGNYRGLTVQVTAASFSGGSGPGALQVPETPEPLLHPIALERKGAELIVLRLQLGDSLREGRAFVPTFTAATPGLLAPGLTALVLGTGTPVLTVVHKLTGDVFAVERTASGPSAAVLDPTAERAYVTSEAEDVVETFDLQRHVREPSFPLLSGDAPAALALTRDGRTLVSVNAGSGTVAVLDAPTIAQRFRLSVGDEPRAVVLSDDDRRAFVLNTGSSSVSVVDLQQGTLLGTLAVDASPRFAALDARSGRLYVGHLDSPYLVVLRVGDLAVERRAYVGPGLVAMAVDPRNHRLFLARRGTGLLEVFDPQSLLPVDTVRTGGDVAFLALDVEGDRLWAAMARGRQVKTFRLVGGEPLSTTDLGTNPAWVVVAGGK
ncbi:MAG TPA: YncE family protein [Candidatus Polarisedimenticolaceae bacterium]|nr:YncE family protein [Candidatus Polarisedimenticolaceae bacterium]